MKRKVKFQEGGAVETPAERRVRLADEARTRSLEYYDDLARRNRQAAADRAASRREFEARRQLVPASGGAGGPPAIPPSSNVATAPGAGRPPMATGGQGGAMVPRPGTDFSGMMREGLSARGRAPMSARPAAGGLPGLAAMAGSMVAPLVVERVENYLRPRFEEAQARRATEQEAARQQRMGAAEAERNRRLDEMRANMPAGPDVEAERAAAAPAARPRPRPQARPQGRSEMTADRLNALAMGDEPMNAEEREAQMRIQQRRRELEGGPAMKKGGVVKKKAGGMIAAKAKAKAAPKKMMKGGVVAKPKMKVKPAMKKGGMVKKGMK